MRIISLTDHCEKMKTGLDVCTLESSGIHFYVSSSIHMYSKRWSNLDVFVRAPLRMAAENPNPETNKHRNNQKIEVRSSIMRYRSRESKIISN